MSNTPAAECPNCGRIFEIPGVCCMHAYSRDEDGGLAAACLFANPAECWVVSGNGGL